MTELNSMSLTDLKSLQKDVAKAIDTFEKRRKSEALATLQAAAKEHGYSLAELIEETAATKKTPTAPKYANPANSADTWSGRGRKPRWFTEAIEGGKSEADLVI